jgi:RNA polymerase sigma-70 factor (ECF subfamily)
LLPCVFTAALMASLSLSAEVFPLPALAAGVDGAAAAGRAFRALVAREGDRWLRLAVRIAGEGDGPDVLQEALVKAWLAAARGELALDTEHDAARWVVRVIVNQAYDAVRARTRRRRWADLFRAVMPTSSGAGAIEARSSIGAVERLLDGLTPEQRIAWVLKEVEGYSGAEIAAMVGASEGAIEQRLLRARAHLERRLRDARP